MTGMFTPSGHRRTPSLNRRRFLGLGVGALAGATLAGCGGDDGSGDTTDASGAGNGAGNGSGGGPVTVWASTAWGESGSAFVQALEEYPGADVRFQGFPANELVDKVTTAISGGGGPDVVLLDVSQVTQFGASGLFADVTDSFQPIAGEFFEGNVRSGQYQGRQYAVPYDTGNVGLFWNQRMFDEAGIDGPPQTWDELLQTSLELTHDGQYGFMMGALGYGAFLWWPWLWQNGGEILTEDLTAAAFNQDPGREAWQFYADLNLVHGVVPPTFLTVTQSWDDYVRPFVTEEVAMMTIGDWGIRSIDAVNPDLEYAVAPLPTGDRAATVLGGNALAVSADSADPDAAWALIEHLVSADQQVVVEEMARLSARRDVVDTDYVQDDPVRLTFATQAEITVARPAIPNWGQIEWGVMAETWDRVIHEQASPLEALDEAAAEVDAILGDS
ncbi:ABC transporter substrate-binding protein [Phytoactinopolyspora limicola]|uniref:ABC transporter substrate-binding protein n=1 Tax=Phytoactinopolyspora limicola TaxID=2715536 RepID=UPI00140DDC4E|nr:sugar ABC transporter substrate-binding protein [Phytoactinopolyspora limicola]